MHSTAFTALARHADQQGCEVVAHLTNGCAPDAHQYSVMGHCILLNDSRAFGENYRFTGFVIRCTAAPGQYPTADDYEVDFNSGHHGIDRARAFGLFTDRCADQRAIALEG